MRGKPWLFVSGGILAAYIGYVLAGKIALLWGYRLQALGELGEFLLFFAAIAAFAMQIIREERQNAPNTEAPNSGFLATLDANAERYLMLACYIFCCAVIIQDVARRALLNYSAAWSQETAQYAFIYLGWIGAAYAVKERAHIRFDILMNRLAARHQGWLFILGEVATLIFALIAFYYSLHTIGQLWRFSGATPVLQVSKIWAEAAVPIGFFLIVLRSCQAISRDLADLRAGRPAFHGKALFEE